MSYRYRQKVLFKHCDPAGIVFYPRYFEMLNDVVEAWFADRLAYPFHEFHRNGVGVPTGRIAVEFSAPSFHGDDLDIDLTATRLGRASLDIHFEARCGAEIRLTANSVLVHIKGRHGAPWPDDIRSRILKEIDE